MTKQGLARHKVISSGRLTGGGRGQALKKRGAGRPLPSVREPAYSLYSTDSEDQVTTIHKGLDRCAALLSGILQAEKAEASSVRGSGRTRAAKSRPLSTLGKERGETERRKQTKRPAVAQAAKKPAPVQKTILSCQSHAGKSNIARSSAETSESASRFNCRLITSTPTLSPQRLPSNSTQSTLAPGPSVCLSQAGGSFSGAASLLGASGAEATSLPPAPFTSSVLSLLAAVPGGSVYEAKALATQATGAPLGGTQVILAPALSPSSEPEEKGCPMSSCCSHTQPQPHLLANIQTQSVSEAPSVSEPSRGSQLCYTQDRRALAGKACGNRAGIAGEEEEEDEECPVKDTSARTSFDKQTPSQLASTNPDPMCVPPDTHRPLALCRKGCGPEGTARHVTTVQHVLGELKALFIGRDNEAERLLGNLETAMSLLPVMESSSNIQAEVALVLQPLRSENSILRRRLKTVNQQLRERERAEREARDPYCDTDVSSLKSELSVAHMGLRELQDDNTELRQALVDTQRQLQHSEAEGGRLGKELQSARAEVQVCNTQLEDCQKQNAAMTLNIQQRETEIRTLQERLRAFHVPPSELPAVTDVSMSQLPLTKQALDQYQDHQGLSDHLVSQYLWSLRQKGSKANSPPCKGPGGVNTRQLDLGVCAPGGQNVCATAEQDVSVSVSQNSRRRLNMDVASWGMGQNPSLDSTGLSLCEVRSTASDWSAGSSSTFDTRDEQDFRNGLAALDASIASLQRTIKQDLKR
ncbi:hypothetical protein DPEC_G00154410 [Dallia pectoralis]|uniref:Uncharacterized protein n=1 Tax=Dallia pectoralis TaxID=75939 RepID=A0ACC2GKL6_DALPE|nr:hypothetical protein DPEC_G00154410 [Dallia pectoralis]